MNDLINLDKAYVLLAMAERNDKMRNCYVTVSTDDLKLAEKSQVNQIKMDGSFHFETTGKIYGLGYGPKYSILNSIGLHLYIVLMTILIVKYINHVNM